MSNDNNIDYNSPEMQKQIKTFQRKLARICLRRWLRKVNSVKMDTHSDAHNGKGETGELHN